MSKLKKYNEFLFEAEEPSVQTTEVNTDTIDKLFIDLKNVVSKKIEENKKLISGYYNKMTKDGHEINTTDQFYTYGRYEGQSDKDIKNRTMTFVIKFNEPTESGLTFNVVSSLELPDLKDIKANEIEIVKKSNDGSKKLERGFINGKYVVKNKDKVNILKPKEEQPKSEDNTSKIEAKIGNVYLYKTKNNPNGVDVFYGLDNKGNGLSIDINDAGTVAFDEKSIIEDKGDLLNYIQKNKNIKLNKKYLYLIGQYKILLNDKKIASQVSNDVINKIEKELQPVEQKTKDKEEYLNIIVNEPKVDSLKILLNDINKSNLTKIDKDILIKKINDKIKNQTEKK